MADKSDPKVRLVEPLGGMGYHYANWISAKSSLYDLRLIFGEVLDTEEDQMTVQGRASVTLSWREADVLRVILESQIKAQQEREAQLGSLSAADLVGFGPVPRREEPGRPEPRENLKRKA